jgi:hypothetical protein
MWIPRTFGTSFLISLNDSARSLDFEYFGCSSDIKTSTYGVLKGSREASWTILCITLACFKKAAFAWICMTSAKASAYLNDFTGRSSWYTSVAALIVITRIWSSRFEFGSASLMDLQVRAIL